MSQVLSHSGYVQDIYSSPETFRKTVLNTVTVIQRLPYFSQIEGIVMRGSSGAAIGFPVAYELGISPVYVRKPGENSHGISVEGPAKRLSNYIIVDDFISTGATIGCIQEALMYARCLGIVLYSNEIGDFINTAGFDNVISVKRAMMYQRPRNITPIVEVKEGSPIVS